MTITHDKYQPSRSHRMEREDTPAELDRSLLVQCDCGDCACDLGDYASGARLGIPLPRPVIYSLELTTACNNQCAGCGNVFSDSRTMRPNLRAKPWGDLLNMISPSAQRLKITGGEPTLHPQFSTILDMVERHGLPFTLFSNARWQDRDAVVDLLLNNTQCTGLLISLHGPDAHSHEAFTSVTGSFSETVSNAQLAAQAGLLVAVSTVLTRHNCSQVASTVDFALSLGVDHVVFNRYLGASLPGLEPSSLQIREAVNTIEALIAKGAPVRYGNPVPQCFAPNSSQGCLAGVAYCTVDPWGNMRPCNHSPTIVGSLLEQSLEELWRSETMRRWRELTPRTCSPCTAFSTCRGSCKALSEIRSSKRDPLIISPLTHAASPLQCRTHPTEVLSR